MYTIYKGMYDIIKQLDDEDVPIEPLKLLFEKPPLLKAAIKSLANKRIKEFIKKVMKEQFDKFIDDTIDIWNDMTDGEILRLNKTAIQGAAIDMFGYPFHVTYFFKQEVPEGLKYTFLDDDANKIYSDYRVIL